MTQHIYWDAPLWEVLLLGIFGLALMAWLLGRAVRRTRLSAALAAIEPALNEQPLFFFDWERGVIALNDGAERVMDVLRTAQGPPFPLDVLADALHEAQEENRVVYHEGWPDAGSNLVAAPVASQVGGTSIGVLAMIVPEPPLALLEGRVDEPAASSPDWIEIGATLRLQRQRPVVRVQRIDPPMAGQAAVAWQENQLSPTEDALLRYLLEHANEVHAAEALFSAVWIEDEVDTLGLRPDQRDRLRRLVFQLRQHVEPNPSVPRYVCTAHGMGYVLYADEEGGAS